MEWQDVAAALNRLEEPPVVRDVMRAARRFGPVGYSTEEDLPTAEVEHDTAMRHPGVRRGAVKELNVYQHVVGPVHPYLRFRPGPIGGRS